MTTKCLPRAITDLSDGVILAPVDLDAQPERVFKTLSTKEILTWWGDEKWFRTTGWDADLRVGGLGEPEDCRRMTLLSAYKGNILKSICLENWFILGSRIGITTFLQSLQKEDVSNFYLCRLIPPRPTFAFDMSEGVLYRYHG
ncbi:MAG: hypothetical protein PHO08_17955 [Methylococcales bacterium]|nr:hypothetical protein [Methylococcales bacterium]